LNGSKEVGGEKGPGSTKNRKHLKKKKKKKKKTLSFSIATSMTHEPLRHHLRTLCGLSTLVSHSSPCPFVSLGPFFLCPFSNASFLSQKFIFTASFQLFFLNIGNKTAF
jgi:hypothetical protein